ncbi:MAG: single-stranded-DNA-specific exonuclease RecJ [Bacteroidota bacterium]|nr:single-stranded-DNA-specific exonuclease RecJ [Bacteroidota bacterium]
MSWIKRPLEDPQSPAQLSSILNDIPLPIARALVLRGIDTFDAARRYFRPAMQQTYDPFRLAGMAAAADRLARAVEHREKVHICGDFDADGVTSTTILLDFLSSQGCTVSFSIPDRFIESHGFHRSGVDQAIECGASLIVVVDCGTDSVNTADYAAGLERDVIICDHHESKDIHPQCVALVNPMRSDCPYPFKEIAACGLAYKLVLATLDRLGRPPDAARPLLELVAIGTIADVMPLIDENRVLVREGLEILRQTTRPGLRALATGSRLTMEKLVATDVSMKIAPMLNAAGRLEHAEHAVRLLRASADEADMWAVKLSALNETRKDQSRRVQTEARKEARKQMAGSYTHALVLVDPKWHPGVLGPAASQIANRFTRPTLLLTAKPPETVRNPEFLTGSARSIEGVNIHDAIASCEDLLDRFGGHAAAAGVTLRSVDYQLFRERLDAYVKAHCDPDFLISRIYYDAELRLADIPGRFMALLRQFQPTGKENEPPVFRVRDAYVSSVRTVGINHLQLQVRGRHADSNGNGDTPQFRCIAFGLGKLFKKLEEMRQTQSPVEMLCAIEDNTYLGRTTTQLRVEQIRAQTSDP